MTSSWKRYAFQCVNIHRAGSRSLHIVIRLPDVLHVPPPNYSRHNYWCRALFWVLSTEVYRLNSGPQNASCSSPLEMNGGSVCLFAFHFGGPLKRLIDDISKKLSCLSASTTHFQRLPCSSELQQTSSQQLATRRMGRVSKYKKFKACDPFSKAPKKVGEWAC